MAGEENPTKFDTRAWAENFQHQFTVFIEGMKEDFRHRDDQIKTIVQQQGKITENVSKLTARVESLTEGQKGVYSRMNRPWQWTLVVSIFLGLFTLAGAFATVLTLTNAPMKDAIEHMEDTFLLDEQRDLQLHIMLKEDIEKNQIDNARQDETLRWLEKLEDRYNDRVHAGIMRGD